MISPSPPGNPMHPGIPPAHDLPKSAGSDADRREILIERLIARLPPKLQSAVRWLRRPSSRLARIAAGILLICGGFLSILPIFGLWMLPLGLILLAEDIPAIGRLRDRLLDWIERRRPHWLGDENR
jgi:hypothetical protein